jgi:hypothetical protein
MLNTLFYKICVVRPDRECYWKKERMVLNSPGNKASTRGKDRPQYFAYQGKIAGRGVYNDNRGENHGGRHPVRGSGHLERIRVKI